MNQNEAKIILQLYRPGTEDAKDPPVAEALELARRERELSAWLEEQNRFHAALRQKFREITAPAILKDQILAQRKIIKVSWWREPVWQRAVAGIILLAGLSAILSLWSMERIPNRFSDYEKRMVRSALREYHMDIVTNDLSQVRRLMTTRGAPDDFSLPKGLTSLTLTGGGVLRWRDQPVAMVCFDRGDQQMLFLFVMNRSAVKDPPPAAPEVDRVSKLVTASWSEGDKTYLLAGPEEINFLQKYF